MEALPGHAPVRQFGKGLHSLQEGVILSRSIAIVSEHAPGTRATRSWRRSSQFLAQVWFLAFSAGAMIFVVAEDLIPEAVSGGNDRLGAWGVMTGFAVMMALDVALG